MTRDEYIKRIVRQLDCDRAKKKRIQSDLESDINMALDSGETMEEIIDRMGAPEEIAGEFMETIRETGGKKAHSQGIFILVGACMILIIGILMNILLTKVIDIGVTKTPFQEIVFFMICWLVMVIVLVIVELLTQGLTTIWFAGGALAALITALLGGSPLTQVIVFCVVTAVLLFLTRPIAMKYFNRNREKTNVESLIGKTAVVTQDIDNIQGQGEAVVNGMIWTARSVSDAQKLAKGEAVQIVRISGAKLIVKRLVNP